MAGLLLTPFKLRSTLMRPVPIYLYRAGGNQFPGIWPNGSFDLNVRGFGLNFTICCSQTISDLSNSVDLNGRTLKEYQKSKKDTMQQHGCSKSLLLLPKQNLAWTSLKFTELEVFSSKTGISSIGWFSDSDWNIHDNLNYSANCSPVQHIFWNTCVLSSWLVLNAPTSMKLIADCSSILWWGNLIRKVSFYAYFDCLRHSSEEILWQNKFLNNRGC